MSANTQFDLQQFLATRTQTVNAALDQFLPSDKTRPATIHKAMRYSLFAGGKRMRPALCLATAAAGIQLAHPARNEVHQDVWVANLLGGSFAKFSVHNNF